MSAAPTRHALVAALALAGCAGTLGAAGGSRYRVGDHVVYRYTRRGAPPVLLREEVTAREGRRLTIEVTARRGDEGRRFVQVVTDTPENQRAGRVDELYEVRDGQRVRLPNARNADLYRLYAWTLPPIEGHGRPSAVTRASVPLAIAGTTFACTEERGRLAEAHLSYALATCPAFLWTNGPGRVVRDDGAVVWSREVVVVGRR